MRQLFTQHRLTGFGGFRVAGRVSGGAGAAPDLLKKLVPAGIPPIIFITYGILLVIILMVFFRRVEIGERRNFRHNRFGEPP